jgi:hypothetical protein
MTPLPTRTIVLGLLCLSLGACASTSATDDNTRLNRPEGLNEAMAMKTQTPEKLKSLARIYGGHDRQCIAVLSEIGDWNSYLGAEKDERIDYSPRPSSERGKEAGIGLAVGFLMQYPGLVVGVGRAVTDYEHEAANRAKSELRALRRRAYLIGVADGLGCQPDLPEPINPAPRSGSKTPAVASNG